jgi:hypothetical protein
MDVCPLLPDLADMGKIQVSILYFKEILQAIKIGKNLPIDNLRRNSH